MDRCCCYVIFVVFAVMGVTRCTHVRLYGGNTTAGIVQIITLSGDWATICDDQWDDDDARVVCRELGLGGGDSVRQAPFQFGIRWHLDTVLRNSQIDRIDVLCTGSEGSVLDCPHEKLSEDGIAHCDHSEDAGVVCSAPPEQTTIKTTTKRQTSTERVRSENNAAVGDISGGVDSKHNGAKADSDSSEKEGNENLAQDDDEQPPREPSKQPQRLSSGAQRAPSTFLLPLGLVVFGLFKLN